LLISPVLGVMIAYLTGLIDPARHSTASLVASAVYFSFVSFVIWSCNRWLYLRLSRREDWLERPARRLGLLLATIVLVSIPVAAVLIVLWRMATGDRGTHPYALPVALLGIVTVVVVITHVYETVFLLRDWESDRLRSARIEKARLEAELEALGREVDPHFLFNNLNALVHLIDERREGALPFINALSSTYRYVLDVRGRRLVSLAEELDSLRRHQTLAAIRFGPAIVVQVDIDAAEASELQIPPVALSELFQNAIKHNAVDPAQPLRIRVRVENTSLVFANELQTRSTQLASTGVGLKNLSQRVKLATGREVAWGAADGWFVVRVPLLK
jgi:signal transduction histidine kinase